MKKRVLSFLTVLCMVLSLMPGVALASLEIEVMDYSALVAALAEEAAKDDPGSVQFIPAEDFGWPENAVLTIPAFVRAWSTREWEIPEGVTVVFETNSKGLYSKELTINGTIQTSYSSQDSVLSQCKKVIVGPSANFLYVREDGRTGLAGHNIPAEKVWEVQAGANLNADISLGGTLTGEGTVSGGVTVNGGFSGSDRNAVISGELTFVDRAIQLGREGSEYADTLTIPAGSHIKLDKGGALQVYSAAATIYLDGKVELLDGVAPEWGGSCFISFREAGKLVMGAGSEIILRAPSEFGQNAVGWEEEERFSAATQDQFPRFVEGSGTIKFYGDEAWYGFFHSSPDDVVRFLEDTDRMIPVERYVDFTNITIFRSWMCAHVFENGDVVTEPTCTEPGAMAVTCIHCGTDTTTPIPPKGHTEAAVPAVEPTVDTCGYTEGTACADCGITMSGREKVPALFAALTPSVDDGKLTVVGAPEETVSVAVAFYDADGGLLGIGLRTISAGAMSEHFDLPEGAASYTLFAMDASWSPGCESFGDEI